MFDHSFKQSALNRIMFDFTKFYHSFKQSVLNRIMFDFTKFDLSLQVTIATEFAGFSFQLGSIGIITN